jgi:hypothetical protein
MNRPSRLPRDCPACERCGVITLDDDAMLPCPLCNNWCMLCLAGVQTFVSIARPYRGALVAGMRPTIDGERLFEGYVCDYHKATLRSYSYIAPPMVGCYEAGQSYIAMQGRVFVVRYAYGQAANWQELEETARQVVASYRYAPYGPELCPCPAELAARVVR